MHFLIKNRPFVGIDLDGESLSVATLRKAKNKWQISQLSEKKIQKKEGTEAVKPVDIPKNYFLVSSLPAKHLLVRQLTLALKRKRDVFKALEFQAEPLLPFPLSNAILQGQIVDKIEDKNQVTFFAARKDHLQNHLTSLKEIGIEPDGVSTASEGLAALSSLLFPEEKNGMIVVHINGGKSLVLLVKEGKALAQRTLGSKEELAQGIEKAILSLLASFQNMKVEVLLLFGLESRKLAPQLQKATSLNCHVPSGESLKGTSFSFSEKEFHAHAVAIGVAVAQQRKDSICFRQKEFLHPRPLRHLKNFFCGAVIAALMVLTMMGFWGYTTYRGEQKQLERQTQALLNLVRHQDDRLMFDSSTLQEQLPKVREILSMQPLEYPLIPRIPRVQDLIEWLHEQLKESPLGSEIKIESIDYKMVKRPSATKPQERYLVKVNLEFSTHKPQAARSFKEFLSAPNQMVDQNYEIEWSQAVGCWRACFYLKDQTRYG